MATTVRARARRMPAGTPDVESFLAKVDKTGSCWLWTAGLDNHGYGAFNARTNQGRRRTKKAHRWSYEHHVGPIPDGLDLDHLCRVRSCVNPDHLEPVTRGENIRRGDLSDNNGRNAWTHCPRGHPYDAANTYVCPQGTRNCRACRHINATKRLQRAS